ncbi:hypothetical protein E4U52_006918 [Claviceps spartinae]|nr:hypothetical protein E4U52_006918 [Claviceps spartinae]
MASFRPLAVRPMAVLLPMLGGSKRSQGRAQGQRRRDKTEWNGSNRDCTVIAHDDRGEDTYQRCSRVAWLMLMVALMERMCGRGKEELAGEVGRFCRLEPSGAAEQNQEGEDDWGKNRKRAVQR